MPMHFIMMDLRSKFLVLPQGHQYTLTVIDILMNYTWCIQPNTKEAAEVVHTYSVHTYSKFGRLHKILSDNGTELKNKLFMYIASIQGMKQVFTSPYCPQGNECTENVNNVLDISI